MRSHRGISDVIAFTLMFTIIIASAGVVSTVGFDQLFELRDDEQINSAERAMEGFASTVGDIQRNADPYRTVAFSLTDGGIWFNESAELAVNVGGNTWTSSGSLQHFLSDDVTVTYEAGGVFRSDGIETYEPRLSYSPSTETLVISLVNLTTENPFYVAASGGGSILGDLELPQDAPVRDVEQTLRLQVEHVNSTVTFASSGPVTLDVAETAGPMEWTRYLSSADNWTANGGGVFEFTPSVDTVLVRVTTIRLIR